jgi:hypothetical protein
MLLLITLSAVVSAPILFEVLLGTSYSQVQPGIDGERASTSRLTLREALTRLTPLASMPLGFCLLPQHPRPALALILLGAIGLAADRILRRGTSPHHPELDMATHLLPPQSGVLHPGPLKP